VLPTLTHMYTYERGERASGKERQHLLSVRMHGGVIVAPLKTTEATQLDCLASTQLPVASRLLLPCGAGRGPCSCVSKAHAAAAHVKHGVVTADENVSQDPQRACCGGVSCWAAAWQCVGVRGGRSWLHLMQVNGAAVCEE
jgi:hypothetical protein